MICVVFVQRSGKTCSKLSKQWLYKPRMSSLFDVQPREVIVMQDCKELLSAKLEHVPVTLEFEHIVSQGLGVCLSQTHPLLAKCMKQTFHSEETQVVNAPLMDEVIRVYKPILGGDLVGIEKWA